MTQIMLSYAKFQMVRSSKFRMSDGNPNSVYDASLLHPRLFNCVTNFKN